MRAFIITGTSRGIGEALARRLMAPNHLLFCISRTRNESLIAEAKEKGAVIYYYECDLKQTEGLEPLLERIFHQMNPAEMDGIYLVNNAGVLEPIAPLDKCSANDIVYHVQINLIAPFILTAAFIRHTADYRAEKRILNISSGAAKHPYYGWSLYCSTKAGIDMLTRTVALEQRNRSCPVKIASVAPGVIDTQMQDKIRLSSKENFEKVEQFIQLKEQGKLVSPETAAEKLSQYLLSDEFKQGDCIDIRDRY